MRNNWNQKNINEFGLDCLADLFTFKELATKMVEPSLKNKRGNKKALDQDKVNLIKSNKNNFIRKMLLIKIALKFT